MNNKRTSIARRPAAATLGLVSRLALAVVPVAASAETFYVAPYGDDSAAGSFTAPFATVQRAANAANPGDSVLIRAGTYRETISPPRSGTATAPIRFEAFPGERVVVSGADPVDGWTPDAGSVYRASATLPVTGYSDTGFFANQVFVDGVMVPEARWPNVNTADRPTRPQLGNGGIDAVDDVTVTIDKAPLPSIGEPWTGATVWMNEWFVSRTGTVTAEAPDSLTASMSAGWRGGYVNYLTGKKGLLDSEGEWFYDGSSLYLWGKGGAAPTKVEVKKRNLAFDLTDRSHFVIKGINLFASTVTTGDGSEGVVIDGVRAAYVSHHVTLPPLPVSEQAPNSDNLLIVASHAHDTGLQLRGRGHTLRNSIISYSSGNGVLLEGEDHVVENNAIHGINYQSSYCSGVRINGSGHKVLKNAIFDSGRGLVDVDFHTSGLLVPDLEIGFNELFNFGGLSADLGAVYLASSLLLDGGRIHHNVVRDPYSFSPFWNVSGIYADNNSVGATYDHNVIFRMSVPLTLGLSLPGNASGRVDNVYNNTSAVPVGIGNPPGVALNNLFPSVDGYSGALDPSNIVASPIDPLVNSLVKGDLTLASGSAAVDAGTPVPGITTDAVGAAPDVGAFESGTPPWRAGPEFPQASATTTIYDEGPKSVDADFRYELGTAFTPLVPGDVRKVRIFTAPSEAGSHAVRIWRRSGGLLVAGPFTWNVPPGEPGWKEFTLPATVKLDRGEEYVVSVSNSTDKRYVWTSEYHAEERRSGDLVIPHGAGLFSTTLGGMPYSEFEHASYSRDVSFESAAPAFGEKLYDGDVRPLSSTQGALELGVRFRPSAPGNVLKARAVFHPTESGVHVVRLWKGDGTLVAGPFDWKVERGTSGWREFTLPAPAPVEGGVDYVMSVSTGPDGTYVFGPGDFDTPRSTTTLTAAVGSGVFSETTGGMPSQSFRNASYYRDVVFVPASRQSARIDEIVPRTGRVTVGYSGAETNLNLTSLGRRRLPSGEEVASVWRLRNGSQTDRALTLSASDGTYSVTVVVPGRSDAIVESPRAAATHVLRRGPTTVSTKASDTQAFADSRIVPVVY